MSHCTFQLQYQKYATCTRATPCSICLACVSYAVAGMLPQEPEVLLGARPAQQAEGVLLMGRDDQVHAPYLSIRGEHHAKHLFKPAHTFYTLTVS